VRRSTLLLTVVLGLGALGGCSGGGPYCEAVDRGRDTLATFGERTDEAYAAYAEVTADIAAVAPSDVRQEWKAIAKATRRVVKAQKKAGVRLQDMDDDEVVNALTQADIDRLDAAYEAFNDTKTQRKDMVRHVHDECGIDLSEK